MIETRLLAFIPLFVAIDILGVIPLFLSLTGGLEEQRRRVLISSATITAFAVAITFLVFGKLIFSFVGITVNDFRIGKGLFAFTGGDFRHDDSRRDQ